MIQVPTREDLRAHSAIEAAIALHGAWAVLFAAISALLRGRMRKTRPPDAGVLCAHMRADIGLPPQGPPPEWLRHGPAGFRR